MFADEIGVLARVSFNVSLRDVREYAAVAFCGRHAISIQF